nr:immunoglobulin light chain junction region [Macaca mulatta]
CQQYSDLRALTF